MPGLVPPVSDEREGLIGFLEQQRYVLRLTAYGLTDGEARMTESASPLSVGGLIKHVTAVEKFWTEGVLLGRKSEGSESDYEENFRLGPTETLAGILDAHESQGRETNRVIASFDDLGDPVAVPSGVPWFPADVDFWSVRWVVLHLITETARHAGHADIIRESVDGATAFPVMAAAENWPATPWMQPWEKVESAKIGS